MDGNRRFAREGNKKVEDGYERGADSVFQVRTIRRSNTDPSSIRSLITLSCCSPLQMLCMFSYLPVQEFSLFAFSVENFKRPQEEIDYLMQVFYKTADKILSIKSKKEDHFMKSMNICFVGNTELLEEPLQKIFKEVEMFNDTNKK
jgi:undecaprenyl pyrophosphate synthase